MTPFDKKPDFKDQLALKVQRMEMEHLQWIEDNPLDDKDKAMFKMFEREGWSQEQRRAYILEEALNNERDSRAK